MENTQELIRGEISKIRKSDSDKGLFISITLKDNQRKRAPELWAVGDSAKKIENEIKEGQIVIFEIFRAKRMGKNAEYFQIYVKDILRAGGAK